MSRLRVPARLVLAIGAASSVALVVYAGRRNPSRVVIGLFVLWVLAPPVGLWLVEQRSAQWPALTRVALYVVMLVVAVGPPAIYAAVAFGPPRAQAAFAFVIVPPLAGAMSALILGAAAFIARRPSRRDGQ